jgi:hypothetical protein
MNQIAALFLAVTTFVQGLFGIKTVVTPPLPTPVVNESIKISLVPTPTDLEIHLSGKNQKLSAIAIRLVYKSSKSGLIISPNTALTTQNWMFPVKTATVKNGTVVFDLAAANVSTTGFELGPDLLIAKINLPQADLSKFSFDQKETKIYDKSTVEVPLVF